MPDPAIDTLRDAFGHLDRAAIHSILPYGDDFLFVDNVSRLTDDEIEAGYTVPVASPFLRAHFEGLPIMPGVLIGEGMAQAGTIVVRYNLEAHQTLDILAFQIDGARFVSPAQPGDRLIYRVRLIKLRRQVAKLEGTTFIGDRKVCEASIVLAIIAREQLRRELAALDTP